MKAIKMLKSIVRQLPLKQSGLFARGGLRLVLVSAVVIFSLWNATQASFAQQWNDASAVYIEALVEEMPEDESGIGRWLFSVDSGNLYTLTVTEVANIISYPSVGDRVEIFGLRDEDGAIEVLSIVPLDLDLPDADDSYWDAEEEEYGDTGNGEPDFDPEFGEDFDVNWQYFDGVVASAPENEMGMGEWEIQLDSGEIITLLADEHTYFRSSIIGYIPTAQDEVFVISFLTPDGTLVATDIELLSGEGDDEYFVGDIEELVGIITDMPQSTEPLVDGGTEAWIIETLDIILPVLITDDTTFVDGRPSQNDRVSIWGYKDYSGFHAVEVAADQYETGQIIVRLHTDTISQTIASRYDLFADSAVLKSGGIYKFVSFNPREQHVQRVINQMGDDEDILWAERNAVAGLPVEGERHRSWAWGTPTDSIYENQNAYNQISLPLAHTQYRGDGVVIAVLDTGVDLDHPELQPHLTRGWDMVDDDGLPDDEGPGIAWGHGTHVSGIVAKVAPNSKIMPIRVLDSNGRGDVFLVAYAIEWAVDQGADVINLSLGVGIYPRVLHEAVQYATDNGAVVVAASGNSNTRTPQYPAAFLETIGVAAVDSNNQKASFSNYGEWVSMAAPGVGIRSTIVGQQGSGYATWDGTSMAAPFVAGAAALVHQRAPSASSYAVSELLRDPSGQFGQLASVQNQARTITLLDVASAVGLTVSEPNDVAVGNANMKIYLPAITR